MEMMMVMLGSSCGGEMLSKSISIYGLFLFLSFFLSFFYFFFSNYFTKRSPKYHCSYMIISFRLVRRIERKKIEKTKKKAGGVCVRKRNALLTPYYFPILLELQRL